MPMTLEVDGAGRLVDALSKFNKEIYSDLLAAVRHAAEAVAVDARRRTPTQVLFGSRPFGNPSAGWGKWTETRGRMGSSGSITFETSSRSLDWDQSQVDRGIRPGARKRRVRGAGTVGVAGMVSFLNPAGAIWSTAGADNPGGLKNAYFNPAIIARFGADYPRALKPALFAKGPEAAVEIDRALERAVARFGLN
jgi:hypothetical protein